MDLALGTVQFGLGYGVAGRGAIVPAREVRRILRRASQSGVRVLDTAAVYGDIESKLALLAEGLPFEIISKIQQRPAGLQGAALTNWAGAQVRRSIERLGPSLRALLFHRADDLLDDQGPLLWEACKGAARDAGLKLGVSCYDVQTFRQVLARYPVALVQLPGNAMDQRIRRAGLERGDPLEVHLRSAFLQGLLLMPETDAAARVPSARGALEQWHRWCRVQKLSPLSAALGLVKGLPGVHYCVVGVDNLEQFEEIVRVWRDAPALQAPELEVNDAAVIDPRQWRAEPG